MDSLCTDLGWTLNFEEIDILREGEGNNLAPPLVQKQWVDRIRNYEIVICTPPCSNFSRAPWANSFGPHPVRSAAYPEGFPWLSGADRDKADFNNAWISFLWDVLDEIDRLQPTQCIVGFAEHPEDLGRVRHGSAGDVPASIWRAKRFLRLVKRGWWSGAFRQSDYEAPTAKPTRSTSNSFKFESMAPHALPVFK